MHGNAKYTGQLRRVAYGAINENQPDLAHLMLHLYRMCLFLNSATFDTRRKLRGEIITVAVLCCGVLVQASKVDAATYYFSSSQGSDSNSGTSTLAPKKSLGEIYYKGAGIAKRQRYLPGDQILLLAGDTFHERIIMPGTGAPNSHIIIGRYGEGSNPVLVGDNLSAEWNQVQGRTNIYSAPLAGVLVIAKTNGTLYTQMPTLYEFGGTQDEWLDTFTHASWGKLTAGGTSVFVKTSEGEAPSGGKLRAFHKPVEVSGSYVTVEHLDVRRAYYGISVSYATNAIVRHCNVEDTCGCGIRFFATVSGEMFSNTVTRTGWTSTYIGDRCISNRMSFNRISFATNTILGVLKPFREAEELGGIGMKQGRHNLVEYNHVSHVGGFVDTYLENGSTVRYNYFHNSRLGSGIAPHGTGWHIHHNVFNFGSAGQKALGGFWAYDDSASYGPPLGTNLICHNIFYNFKAYGFYSGQNYGPGVVLKNNIFVGANGANLVQSWTGPDSDYNLFYCLGTPDFFWDAKRTGHTLASYQVASSMERHSIYADPQFVSDHPVTAADFRLKPTSPCINAGFDLKKAGVLAAEYENGDFLGTLLPQGSAPDIGAFEYKSGTPSTPPNLRLN